MKTITLTILFFIAFVRWAFASKKLAKSGDQNTYCAM